MSAKKFLILQLRPESEVSDNEFASFLKYGGLKEEGVSRIRAEISGVPKLNLNDYSAIIVGGSPFDLSTPLEVKSAIQLKIESDFQQLLEQVVEQDFPFLGACSGIGLLGSYCGSTISAKYSEPVGGVDVILTSEGKSDPLLSGFPNTFRALVGHKEACDSAPKNATLLATSKTCPVQMFRVKKNIYATQFHPEADPDVFILRIKIYKHHGYFSPAQADQLIESVSRETAPVPHEILERFVRRYQDYS